MSKFFSVIGFLVTMAALVLAALKLIDCVKEYYGCDCDCDCDCDECDGECLEDCAEECAEEAPVETDAE